MNKLELIARLNEKIEQMVLARENGDHTGKYEGADLIELNEAIKNHRIQLKMIEDEHQTKTSATCEIYYQDNKRDEHGRRPTSNKLLIDCILNQYNAYKEAYENCLETGRDKFLYRLERLMAARKKKLSAFKAEFMQIYPEQTIFSK